MNLSDYSTDQLVNELSRRGALPPCRCRKWQTYMGSYDRDGYTLRCHGCLRAVANCTC
ncbi:MAG: hypothetical protein KGL39_12110 [Patescibacteria group bacterium]|nr:hypothetical protein [Patescibacteria group bacterium]